MCPLLIWALPASWVSHFSLSTTTNRKKIVCVIITIRPQQVTFVGALYEFSKMILFNIIATKCTSQLNLQPSAKRHSMIFFFAIHRLTTQAVEPVSGESRDPKKPRSTRDFDRENHRKNIFFIFIHSYTRFQHDVEKNLVNLCNYSLKT